ncbi:MAG: hypothetical protein MR378_02910 [Ruminococcus sp.]|nr:hypothetical protein [Ruminococcus sp.]MDD6945553.1 hypothetical protein [Ruminococcus sp.]
MPVVVIVFWEMPIWLLVLAGLCVLGVSACEYIPIICAIVTFLISLVSMNVSASSTLEKRKAAQIVGFKKGLQWVMMIWMSFVVSTMMYAGMQGYVEKASGDVIGRAFSFIEMGVNNIPVFIGVSVYCAAFGKMIGDILALKNIWISIGSYLTIIVPIVFYFALKREDVQESTQCKQILKDYMLKVLSIIAIMFCISIGW